MRLNDLIQEVSATSAKKPVDLTSLLKKGAKKIKGVEVKHGDRKAIMNKALALLTPIIEKADYHVSRDDLYVEDEWWDGKDMFLMSLEIRIDSFDGDTQIISCTAGSYMQDPDSPSYFIIEIES